MSLECKNCGHQFEPFENFVRLELRFDDALGKLEYLCEQCFFEYALNELRATSVKTITKATLKKQKSIKGA